MKAIVCRKPGTPDVLELEDIEKPVVAQDGVLVRVHAASVNPVDLFPLTRVAHVSRLIGRRFRPETSPVVPGTDFAGTVEAVGPGVTQFQVGDEVFGGTKGTFAEYVCLAEQDALVRKPANITFEQAAAVPVAALTALQALRDHGGIQPGQKVLINGASGGVGTFAVQIARSFGTEVTGVCSPTNVDIVRSIGAARVIDYTQQDFTRDDVLYDLLLDIAGNRSWSEYTRVLAPRGTFVAIGASAVQRESSSRALKHFASTRLASLGNSRRWAFFIAKLNKADLMLLRELLETGKVTPVVDRRYALSEVPAALHYMAEGHAKGKIVVNVTS